MWVSSDKLNAKKVYKALKEFGAPLSNIGVEDFMNEQLVYQMGIAPSRIDILMGLKELRFEECWKKRFRARYGNIQTQFLSREQLITNKAAVGRPQDLIDVEHLLLSKSLTTHRKRQKKP